MTKNKIVIISALSAIALLAIGFALGVYGAKQNSSLGGTSYDASYLVGDVFVGKQANLAFRDGAWQMGPIATTSLFTSTGGITNSGVLTQSGAAALSGQVTINQVTSSTLRLAGLGGCISMPLPGTSTLVYFTATTTADTILASTVKPAGCR